MELLLNGIQVWQSQVEKNIIPIIFDHLLLGTVITSLLKTQESSKLIFSNSNLSPNYIVFWPIVSQRIVIGDLKTE